MGYKSDTEEKCHKKYIKIDPLLGMGKICTLGWLSFSTFYLHDKMAIIQVTKSNYRSVDVAAKLKKKKFRD